MHLTTHHPLDGRVREHFLADHRRLEALLTKLLDAFAADDRESIAQLWNEFDTGLVRHLDAEERHLIPALQRAREQDARKLVVEHGHIRKRLLELGIALDLHMVRLATARAFIDELRAHAHAEDRLLYGWADDHLDAASKDELLNAPPWPPPLDEVETIA